MLPEISGGEGTRPTPDALRQTEALIAPLLRGLTAMSRRLDSPALLRSMIEEVFPGRIAVVTAFGAESAVLLDLVAQVDRDLPVIFLETGKHFPETLAYRDRLIEHLGLSDVRSVVPSAKALAAEDPDGKLWSRDPDRCCTLRKVLPLEAALKGFDAWITGRKRYQGDGRTALEAVELVDGRFKINPLAHWSREAIEHALVERDLPRHPLAAEGYASIGCAPCTRRATCPAADPRSGRWAGLAKTECGIHKAPWAAGLQK
ncbi:MAG: phosphoadenylyl-sulfate reductase [Kiloniellales bacterium]